jgi:hypothetical protein
MTWRRKEEEFSIWLVFEPFWRHERSEKGLGEKKIDIL